MGFFHEAETWVLVAFILFVGLLVYLKVPGMAAQMLDLRAAGIAEELENARKLRAEAEALLASYEAKRVEAEKLASDIVNQAHTDAVEYAAESRRKLGEMLERLTRQAEQKIAQAEAAAVKDVRNAAAELAISAASRLMAEAAKGPKGAELIANSIEAVKTRLN